MNLLDNPEYFYCERLRGIWKRSACVEWQTGKHIDDRGVEKKCFIRPTCKECPQGQKILKEMTGKVASTIKEERQKRKEVGERIREMRGTLGMTQMALGKAVGVPYGDISLFETGKKVCPQKVIEKIEEMLGVKTAPEQEASRIAEEIRERVGAGVKSREEIEREEAELKAELRAEIDWEADESQEAMEKRDLDAIDSMQFAALDANEKEQIVDEVEATFQESSQNGNGLRETVRELLDTRKLVDDDGRHAIITYKNGVLARCSTSIDEKLTYSGDDMAFFGAVAKKMQEYEELRARLLGRLVPKVERHIDDSIT